MSRAVEIRDAIVTRLTGKPWLPVATIRRQPLPQLQPDELPGLMVVILSEDMIPDGEDNVGVPAFEVSTTIGISLVVGFDEASALDADIDVIASQIETTLLTDPSFVRFTDSQGNPGLFEAVTGIRRRRMFPHDGESYFVELRLDITFRHRVYFDPVIPDPYEKTVLTAKLAGTGPDTPTLTVVVDQAQ